MNQRSYLNYLVAVYENIKPGEGKGRRREISPSLDIGCSREFVSFVCLHPWSAVRACSIFSTTRDIHHDIRARDSIYRYVPD